MELIISIVGSVLSAYLILKLEQIEAKQDSFQEKLFELEVLILTGKKQ